MDGGAVGSLSLHGAPEAWAEGDAAEVARKLNNWSFAGSDSRADVSQTLLQPFVSYQLPSLTTFSLNNESTYDWEGDELSVPVNLGFSQLFRVGKQLQTLQFGVRYGLDSPEGAAEGWGVRLTYTLVFPK